MESISNKISKLRIDNKLSQNDLSEKLFEEQPSNITTTLDSIQKQPLFILSKLSLCTSISAKKELNSDIFEGSYPSLHSFLRPKKSLWMYWIPKLLYRKQRKRKAPVQNFDRFFSNFLIRLFHLTSKVFQNNHYVLFNKIVCLDISFISF